MLISFATPADLPGIQALLGRYGTMAVGEEHINLKDLALVAKDNDEVVGFVWLGLMAEGKVAYLDKLTVHPDYKGKNVGLRLMAELFEAARARGVREFHSFTRRDEFHDAVAVNALRMGASADKLPYTYIKGNLDFMYSQMTEVA